MFASLKESIESLPLKLVEAITNILREIFIPDGEEIKESFNNMIDRITRSLNLPFDSLEFLENGLTEEPVGDIEGDYTFGNLGTLHLKFFDASFLTQGVDYFRPLIRGFTVLMLIFFNYKQLLTFIGQDPGVYANAESKASGGDKK